MDATIARLTRACSTDPGDAGAVDALERALLRAGRTVDAFLLRWRRGEPSPVAAQLAAAQRPALEALSAARPGTRCPECGEACSGACTDLEVGLLNVCPGVGIIDHLEDPAAGPVTTARFARPLAATELEQIARLTTISGLELIVDETSGPTPLTTLAPLPLEGLSLRTGAVGVHELGLESLRLLRRLSLRRPRTTNESLQALVSAVPWLEELSLDPTWSTDEGLRVLGGLEKLERLTLIGGSCSDGSFLEVFTRSESRLRRVEVSGGPSFGRFFFAASESSSIEELYVGCPRAEADELAALADCPRLSALGLVGVDVRREHVEALSEARLERFLLFGDCGVDDAVVSSLQELTRLQELTVWLDGPPSASALAALGALPVLERVRLSALDDAGLAVVATLPALRDLDLSRVRTVSAEGLATLAGAARLERLDLSGRVTTAAELVEVARIPALRALVLALGEDESLAPLANAAGLDRLDLKTGGPFVGLGDLLVSWLGVRATRLDPAALEHLAMAPRLRTLVVDGADAPTLARVRAALPWVEVRRRRPGETV